MLLHRFTATIAGDASSSALTKQLLYIRSRLQSGPSVIWDLVPPKAQTTITSSSATAEQPWMAHRCISTTRTHQYHPVSMAAGMPTSHAQHSSICRLRSRMQAVPQGWCPWALIGSYFLSCRTLCVVITAVSRGEECHATLLPDQMYPCICMGVLLHGGTIP